MSTTPTVPAVDDDAPAPRTPLRRWGLALLVALPVSAAYGVVVMVLGRALFLGAAEEAALAARVVDMPPAVLLWLVATTSSIIGVAYVAREVLEARAARRTGTRQAGFGQWARTGRAWAVPVVLAGSPVAAIVLAAGVAALTSVFRTGDDGGQTAVTFATVAGGSLLMLLMLGWIVILASRDAEPEPHFDEGVEAAWRQRAASRAFWDVMLVAGVAAFVNAVTGDRVSASTVLIGVLLLAQGDFVVRVWVQRRREERA